MDPTTSQQPTFRVDEATGAKLRACNACKRFNIPLLDPRRTCTGCRQKRNDSSRKAREKSRAKMKETELATGDAGQSSSPALLTSVSTHQPPTRKAEQSLQDLEGENRKQAVKITKRPLEATAQSDQPVNKSPSQYPEYQSASLLYEAAKKSYSARGPCIFVGCHSIVRCDDINHRKRAKIVTKDLRKIVRLPFKYNTPCSDVTSEIKCLLRYSCDCSKTTTVVGSSESSAKKTKNADTAKRPCGGFVIVTVRDDDSHDLGIPGQQVVVEIQH